ncbi:YwpF-like family protein [Cytobacillus sp. S13-E01]|uniref:YwpF-like family protein n=1 Tax=Cytobacillus sp. S13-E01 TaxID=3031326 RepID=UPI0023D82CCC|nr:YwpF-like family protein [Cytobacillus sp. S13-E01]MDF0727018.1 YwpF-like family protein [Cytobacillus sp. S13-E01]
MKTFKLVSLAIVHDQQSSKVREEITLLDGLIINKEDGENRWLMEAFIDKKYLELFETLQKNDEEVHLHVTISKKSNDPASIFGKVKSITKMDEHLSILFDGTIKNKIDLAEIVLNDLVDQGLQGEQLLTQFKLKLHEKRGTATSAK